MIEIYIYKNYTIILFKLRQLEIVSSELIVIKVIEALALIIHLFQKSSSLNSLGKNAF